VSKDEASAPKRWSPGKLIPWITVALAAGGLAVAVVNILPKSTEVPDYQKQVVATCNRVHSVLSADHGGEIVDLTGLTPEGPRIRKAGLVQVMNGNLTTVRTEFALLDQRKVPSSLVAQKTEAEQAQRAWLDAQQANVQFVEANVRDRELLTDVNSRIASRDLVTAQTAARLNAAMSALAGGECKVTN
jgi:hypothetical protein